MPLEATEYSSLPKLGPSYKKILLSRRSGMKAGGKLPELASHWADATADPEKLKAYREVCDFEDNGNLPILYPHVLTSGMQIGIIADKRFPLSPLGAVHTRMHILQKKAIPEDAKMNLFTWIADQRTTKAGIEFDFFTKVEVDGERVWESVSTNMIRGKFGEPEEPSPLAALPELENANQEESWNVPKDMGRRYAKICGDYNPIHISKILAKLFGFKRDIIHGMWSSAKCLNAIPKIDYPAARLDLAFKGPVFMESTVKMQARSDSNGQRFDLFCGSNPRPCVCGFIRAAEVESII